MTQPFAPLTGLPGFSGGSAPALQGLPGFGPAASPPGAQMPQQGAAPLPEYLRGETVTDVAHRQALRPDVGALETVATQAGRGILDAVLESGALLGAGLESAGAAGGWGGLEDFGRDLGRSSSGAAAMEAASYLFGGGGQKGLSYAERTDKAIREQEEAFPLLSAVSRIGGSVAFGLGTGGLSGAAGGIGATRAGMLGMGAAAGAGSGIQEAYHKNEALRDVLVSGAIGAAFGGGSGALVHAAGEKLASAAERNVMRQLFGDVKSAADDVAQAVKDAGGREIYDAAKTVLSERARVVAEVMKAGDNPNAIRAAYDSAMHAAGAKLSQVAGDFDAASWATKAPSPLQKLLHRTPLLDRVSTDLADDASRLTAARPSLDFELRVPKKLLTDADRPAAIARLQSKVTQALEGAQANPALRELVSSASERLAAADAGGAMAAGHDLVRGLRALAGSGQLDEVGQAFAQRQAANLAGELGGEAWGSAGKAYRALAPDSQLAELTPQQLREALKHADSSRAVPGLFGEEGAAISAAYDARKALGGAGADGEIRGLLRQSLERAERAQAAVTFDGGPARRVLETLSGAGKNIGESYASDLLGMGVGMAIGGVPGMLVARALSPVLGEVASAAFGKGFAKAGSSGAAKLAGGLGEAAATTARETGSWQQFTYGQKLSELAKAVSRQAPQLELANGDAPPDRRAAAVATLPTDIQPQAQSDMQGRLENLLRDIPKPQPNIRGKEFETLSRGDLQKAQAMWEATMQPMSVFADFNAGRVNYDKVQYAWRQYPGLKTAAQAGLMDIITTQMNDKQRAGIRDGMLTQLDNLFGFDGALQPTLDRGFAQRISALGDAAKQEERRAPPRGGGKLETPLMKPTFTERLSGQQG